MIIKAPAKINIGLRILNKREDGFHNLETIFYPVRLYDELGVIIHKSNTDTNSIIIKSEKSVRYSAPLNKNNTCFKSVQSFFKAFRITENYRIEIFLKKCIPIGGGLGGGSSDAGAIIRYLLKYFNINLVENRQRIIDCALEVGSDVPFFLIQKPCYATGKGEKLHLLSNFVVDYDILLVNPNQHVSTKAAYESLRIDGDYSADSVLKKVKTFNHQEKDLFINDFEKVVFEKYPVLKSVKERLYEHGAVFASMSGSGAVLYGFFRKSEKENLKNAINEFNSAGYFTAIA